MKQAILFFSIAILFISVLAGCSKSSGGGGGTTTTSTISADTVSTFAGNGTAGYIDGPVANAEFKNPWGIAVDAQGNVYVADVTNNRIRKISGGVVSTFAGSGAIGSADGIGTSATFGGNNLLAVDASGNIYVADEGGNKIRKISQAGMVTTLAGNGVQGHVDGVAAQAEFYKPSGVAVDAAGNVFVADQWNNCIRKISAIGVVTTLAGGIQGFADGSGTNAQFNGPGGIAVDASDNVYVAEIGNERVRKITPAGIVTTLAGNGITGYADGIGMVAEFELLGLAIDTQNNLYVADNTRIRKITSSGLTTTIAGNGVAGFVNGTGSKAEFNGLWGIAIDATGNIYVTDTKNNCVRKIPTQ